ncbi:rhombosortase [Enterovibrio norvegicus]|uniref:Rhombosortase n=1 Tax=Enterovibrio norvegicus FF-454 TaxID=1185651 RepID=A0A1E5BZX7_9GAMM|nr:rhombosortase [Enterovibrio norvegicus]OEE58803.1 rhombosortase [Enterovibrio norvegicus FF-454]
MSVSRILVALVALTLIAQVPTVHEALVWDRLDIQAGQWWRIVTGNLTHTNAIHMAMNLAALLVLALLHRRYYAPRSLLAMLWTMMVAIGAVMFISPFDWYAGLSGVLHGLFVFGVVRDIQNKVPLGWVMLVGVALKLVHEAYTGGDSMTAELIEAGVAYQAHWAGAAVGLIFALVWKQSGSENILDLGPRT